MNSSAYLSPHFLPKFYLCNAIRKITQTYDFTGSVLDIGCGEKPYINMFSKTTKYIGIDFKSYSKNKEYAYGKPNMYFTSKYSINHRLPFDSHTFDHIVSFQVLEHHPEPEKLIQESRRVIKPGGYLLLSFPFIWSLHEIPHDYCRFSEYYIMRVLKKYKFTIKSIARQGSLFSTLSALINDFLIHHMKKNKMMYFLGVLCYFPLLIFSYFCIILDKIATSDVIFLNYVVLARAY